MTRCATLRTRRRLLGYVTISAVTKTPPLTPQSWRLHASACDARWLVRLCMLHATPPEKKKKRQARTCVASPLALSV